MAKSTTPNLYTGITDIGEWCIGVKVGKNLLKSGKIVYLCHNIKLYKKGE